MKQRYFQFFDLPAELRTAILEYLVIIDSDIPVFAKPETCTESPPMVLIDLLLVCQQMCREAGAVFYTQNKFIINLGSRRMYNEITQDGQLFSPETADARRRIRSVSLRLRRISGDFESMVVPALVDMILNGCLRILDVGILTQGAGLKAITSYRSNHRPGPTLQDPEAANLVKTSPFQAFLRLLADPDLELVTLWVSPVHWSLWCPYHEYPELAGHNDGEKAMIDWKRLVNDFADGNQITKIQRPRFG